MHIHFFLGVNWQHGTRFDSVSSGDCVFSNEPSGSPRFNGGLFVGRFVPGLTWRRCAGRVGSVSRAYPGSCCRAPLTRMGRSSWRGQSPYCWPRRSTRRARRFDSCVPGVLSSADSNTPTPARGYRCITRRRTPASGSRRALTRNGRLASSARGSSSETNRVRGKSGVGR